MKSKQKYFFRNAILIAFLSCLLPVRVQAGTPLWTFVPQTPTEISLGSGDSAQVIYTVHNESSIAKTLLMKPMIGVTQAAPCQLAPNGTCTLTLNVDGSALQGDVYGGPILCQQGNGLQCYQPSLANILRIHLSGEPQTTLSALTQSIALSINSPGSDPALTGNPRTVSIQNTGSIPANNVQVNGSALPAGTTIINNTCSGTLAPGAICEFTISPGSIATSNSVNTSCTASPGTEPVPSIVSVSGSNSSAANVSVLVLGYGCIYQGGFLFTVDDSTPTTGNIGGKVAALSDEEESPGDFTMRWAENFGITTATSITNGNANTSALANPVGDYPAAQSCLNKSAQGYDDWYLPAICELGRYTGLGTDAGCGNTDPNLYSTLFLSNLGSFVGPDYWSSTQFAGSPNNNAWSQAFNNGGQFVANKFNIFRVRCIRAFTP